MKIKPYILKPVACAVILSFLFQDVVWANPDITVLAHPLDALQARSGIDSLELRIDANIRQIFATIPNMDARDLRIAPPADSDGFQVLLNPGDVKPGYDETYTIGGVEHRRRVVPCKVFVGGGEPLRREVIAYPDGSVFVEKPGERKHEVSAVASSSPKSGTEDVRALSLLESRRVFQNAAKCLGKPGGKEGAIAKAYGNLSGTGSPGGILKPFAIGVGLLLIALLERRDLYQAALFAASASGFVKSAIKGYKEYRGRIVPKDEEIAVAIRDLSAGVKEAASVLRLNAAGMDRALSEGLTIPVVDRYVTGDSFEPLMGTVSLVKSLESLADNAARQLESISQNSSGGMITAFDHAGNARDVSLNAKQVLELLKAGRAGSPGILDSLRRRRGGELPYTGIELEAYKFYRALKFAETISMESDIFAVQNGTGTEAAVRAVKERHSKALGAMVDANERLRSRGSSAYINPVIRFWVFNTVVFFVPFIIIYLIAPYSIAYMDVWGPASGPLSGASSLIVRWFAANSALPQIFLMSMLAVSVINWIYKDFYVSPAGLFFAREKIKTLSGVEEARRGVINARPDEIKRFLLKTDAGRGAVEKFLKERSVEVRELAVSRGVDPDGITAGSLIDMVLSPGNLYRVPGSGLAAPPRKLVEELMNLPEISKLFPVYTVALPAFGEPSVIEELIDSISNLIYPRDKLDVILLTETSDTEPRPGESRSTMDLVHSKLTGKGHGRFYKFRVLTSPVRLLPEHNQSKPYSTNYLLGLMEGKYLVIYDAEDRPYPLQILQAVTGFEDESYYLERLIDFIAKAGEKFDTEILRRSDPELYIKASEYRFDTHELTRLVKEGQPDAAERYLKKHRLGVLQASLTWYNPVTLTAIQFIPDYGNWFGIFLPGLEARRLPVSHGGTSNHFLTQALRDVGGWDPHNVTEDAQIASDVQREKYESLMLYSVTAEEAPTRQVSRNKWVYVGQHSRWTKGYLQTLLVSLRNLYHRWGEMKSAFGLRGVVANLLLFGVGTYSYLLTSAFIVTSFLWGASNIIVMGPIWSAGAMAFMAFSGAMIFGSSGKTFLKSLAGIAAANIFFGNIITLFAHYYLMMVPHALPIIPWMAGALSIPPYAAGLTIMLAPMMTHLFYNLAAVYTGTPFRDFVIGTTINELSERALELEAKGDSASLEEARTLREAAKKFEDDPSVYRAVIFEATLLKLFTYNPFSIISFWKGFGEFLKGKPFYWYKTPHSGRKDVGASGGIGSRADNIFKDGRHLDVKFPWSKSRVFFKFEWAAFFFVSLIYVFTFSSPIRYARDFIREKTGGRIEVSMYEKEQNDFLGKFLSNYSDYAGNVKLARAYYAAMMRAYKSSPERLKGYIMDLLAIDLKMRDAGEVIQQSHSEQLRLLILVYLDLTVNDLPSKEERIAALVGFAEEIKVRIAEFGADPVRTTFLERKLGIMTGRRLDIPDNTPSWLGPFLQDPFDAELRAAWWRIDLLDEKPRIDSQPSMPPPPEKPSVPSKDVRAATGMGIFAPGIGTAIIGIDRFLALAGLAVFYVLIYPISAILIKATSRGPVIFTQERIGLNGSKIVVPKLRTCYQDRPDKATGFGKVLRYFGADEFPQLKLVLTGEMAIIGPRPKNEHDIKMLGGDHYVKTVFTGRKPGLCNLHTALFGPNQGIGLIKTDGEIFAQGELDIYEAQNTQAFSKAKIILLTLHAIIFRNDVLSRARWLGIDIGQFPMVRVLLEKRGLIPSRSVAKPLKRTKLSRTLLGMILAAVTSFAARGAESPKPKALSEPPAPSAETLGESFTKYPSGRMETKTVSPADSSGRIYYHFMDENYYGRDYGRVDAEVLGTADGDGATGYEYEYSDSAKYDVTVGDGSTNIVNGVMHAFVGFGDASHASIQPAIDQVFTNGGGVVIVKSGSYDLNGAQITLKDGVILMGGYDASGTRDIATNVTSIVNGYVDIIGPITKDTELSGFDIRYDPSFSGPVPRHLVGIDSEGGIGRTFVINNTLTANIPISFGIEAVGSVSRVVIFNNDILAGSGRFYWAGIHAADGSDNRIEHNRVSTGYGSAVTVNGSIVPTAAVVQNNMFWGNGSNPASETHTLIFDAFKTYVWDNTFIGGESAVAHKDSEDTRVENNVFDGQTGSPVLRIGSQSAYESGNTIGPDASKGYSGSRVWWDRGSMGYIKRAYSSASTNDLSNPDFDGLIRTYEYDADGRLVKWTNADDSYSLVIDHWEDSGKEKTQENYSSGGVLTNRIDYGVDSYSKINYLTGQIDQWFYGWDGYRKLVWNGTKYHAETYIDGHMTMESDPSMGVKVYNYSPDWTPTGCTLMYETSPTNGLGTRVKEEYDSNWTLRKRYTWDKPFHVGVNLPWMDYGKDIGRSRALVDPPLQRGLAQQRAALDENMRQLAGTVCRPFTLCDLRSGVIIDGLGNITGFDEQSVSDLRELLNAAQANGVKLILTIFDYSLAEGITGAIYNNGYGTITQPMGEYPQVITDPAKREQLKNAVFDLFNRVQLSRYSCVIGFDIMNEPEWSRDGLDYGQHSYSAYDPNWQTNRPSQADLESFFAYFKDALHSSFPGKWVTVGRKDREELTSWPITNDVYQFHYYDWMAENPPHLPLEARTAAQLGLDGPVFAGELEPTNVVGKMDDLYDGDYMGGFFWRDGKDFQMSTNTLNEIKNYFRGTIEEWDENGVRQGETYYPPQASLGGSSVISLAGLGSIFGRSALRNEDPSDDRLIAELEVIYENAYREHPEIREKLFANTGMGTFLPSGDLRTFARIFRILRAARPDAEIFFDFGSGDGRVAIIAALCGFRASGVEWSQELVDFSNDILNEFKDRIKVLGLDRKIDVDIKQGNAMEAVSDKQDIIFLCLGGSYSASAIQDAINSHVKNDAVIVLHHPKEPWQKLEPLTGVMSGHHDIFGTVEGKTMLYGPVKSAISGFPGFGAQRAYEYPSALPSYDGSNIGINSELWYIREFGYQDIASAYKDKQLSDREAALALIYERLKTEADSRVREAMITAIGSLGDTRSIKTLEAIVLREYPCPKGYDAPSADSRKAIEAIVEIGSPDALAALERISRISKKRNLYQEKPNKEALSDMLAQQLRKAKDKVVSKKALAKQTAHEYLRNGAGDGYGKIPLLTYAIGRMAKSVGMSIKWQEGIQVLLEQAMFWGAAYGMRIFFGHAGSVTAAWSLFLISHYLPIHGLPRPPPVRYVIQLTLINAAVMAWPSALVFMILTYLHYMLNVFHLSEGNDSILLSTIGTSASGPESLRYRLWKMMVLGQFRRRASVLSSALEAVAEGVLVVDIEGRMATFNRKFIDMWGIPEDIAKSGDDNAALDFVLHKLKDPDLFMAKVRELYSKPQEESLDTIELLDGRVFERSSKPQRDGNVIIGRVWSFKDITGQLSAQRELVLAEKLAVLGELAAQVAHDIKNPITAIGGFLDIAVRALAGGDTNEVAAAHAKMAGQIRRVANITGGLLASVRVKEVRKEDIKISDVMKSAILTNEIMLSGAGIKMETDIDEGIFVHANMEELIEVFVNVIKNAADAMEDVDAKSLFINVCKMEGGTVMAEIRDTGCGADQADVQGWFGHTTKPVGKGTGLGLSKAKRVVEGLGGAIDITTEKGKGTSVKIILPVVSVASANEAGPDRDDISLPAKVLRDFKRVLIVEDENDIRDIYKRFLEGYEVTAVSNGVRALEAVASAREPFDIIIIDYTMPEMNGHDFAVEFRRREAEMSPGDEKAVMVMLTGYGIGGPDSGSKLVKLLDSGIIDKVATKDDYYTRDAFLAMMESMRSAALKPVKQEWYVIFTRSTRHDLGNKLMPLILLSDENSRSKPWTYVDRIINWNNVIKDMPKAVTARKDAIRNLKKAMLIYAMMARRLKHIGILFEQKAASGYSNANEKEACEAGKRSADDSFVLINDFMAESELKLAAWRGLDTPETAPETGVTESPDTSSLPASAEIRAYEYPHNGDGDGPGLWGDDALPAEKNEQGVTRQDETSAISEVVKELSSKGFKVLRDDIFVIDSKTGARIPVVSMHKEQKDNEVMGKVVICASWGVLGGFKYFIDMDNKTWPAKVKVIGLSVGKRYRHSAGSRRLAKFAGARLMQAAAEVSAAISRSTDAFELDSKEEPRVQNFYKRFSDLGLKPHPIMEGYVNWTLDKIFVEDFISGIDKWVESEKVTVTAASYAETADAPAPTVPNKTETVSETEDLIRRLSTPDGQENAADLASRSTIYKFIGHNVMENRRPEVIGAEAIKPYDDVLGFISGGNKVVIHEGHVAIVELKDGESVSTPGLYCCAAFIAHGKNRAGNNTYVIAHSIPAMIREQADTIARIASRHIVGRAEIYIAGERAYEEPFTELLSTVERELTSSGVITSADPRKNFWRVRGEADEVTLTTSGFRAARNANKDTGITLTESWSIPATGSRSEADAVQIKSENVVVSLNESAFFRDLGDAKEATKCVLETVMSILLRKKKLVLAFHGALKGNESRKLEVMLNRLEDLKKDDQFKEVLKGLVIIPSFESAEDLKAMLAREGVDPKNVEDNSVFMFSEIGGVDSGKLDPAVKSVFIREGADFNGYLHYYPLFEIVAIALIKDKQNYTVDEVKGAMSRLGIKFDEVNIDINALTDKLGPSAGEEAFLVFSLIPNAERINTAERRERYALITEYISSAA